MSKADKKRTFRGQLVRTGNGEDSNLLGLLNGQTYDVAILAEKVAGSEPSGYYTVSVRYFLTDTQVPEDALQTELAKVATGDGDIEYGMRYSEITGYLWTDENLKVGGHDLIDELRDSLGKWLHLEVTFHPS